MDHLPDGLDCKRRSKSSITSATNRTAKSREILNRSGDAPDNPLQQPVEKPATPTSTAKRPKSTKQPEQALAHVQSLCKFACRSPMPSNLPQFSRGCHSLGEGQPLVHRPPTAWPPARGALRAGRGWFGRGARDLEFGPEGVIGDFLARGVKMH